MRTQRRARAISAGSCVAKMKVQCGLAVELFDEVEDLPGGDGVEVRGRLVGEDELRLAGHGPGDGHALPLSAGELVGTLAGLIAQADLIEPVANALAPLRRGDVLQQERILDVLVRGEDRDEVEGLEDEAERVAARGGKAVQRDGR